MKLYKQGPRLGIRFTIMGWIIVLPGLAFQRGLKRYSFRNWGYEWKRMIWNRDQQAWIHPGEVV